MKILIAYASKHGATQAIAERIGERLSRQGFDTESRPLLEVRNFAGYDGFVVGSAVYIGKWLPAAAAAVRSHAAILSARPTWMFSSGPTGTKTMAPPREVAEFAALIHPVDHAVFGGVLDKKKLGFGERAVIGVVHAPCGDFREWPAIDSWTDAICSALNARATAMAVTA